MTEFEYAQGCFKCPSHETCYDAFHPNAVHCNHYNRTPEEFEELVKMLRALKNPRYL